jgi:phytoene/squalene synthetase
MSVLFRFVYRVAGAVAGLAGSLYAVAQSVRHYAYKRGGGAVNRKH